MNDTIHSDGNGGFETGSFRRSKLKICECVVPEIRTKCSENGISSYCLKCSKSIKEWTTPKYFNLIDGGVIENGKVIDIGDGYKTPNLELFIDGFKYERTDGFDWYSKVYDGFQKNDVKYLLTQNRIRIPVV